MVANLQYELDQCRKREGAIRAVFIGNHTKEQALSKKALHLEMKELELRCKGAQLNMTSKTLEAERKQLEEQKAITDEHVAEQKRIADAYEAEIKLATESSNTKPISGPPTAKKQDFDFF